MTHRARHVFDQSNGDVTKAYYAQLTAKGPAGVVAMNLFRAQKTSTRAKKYRGGNTRGSYRAQAYAIKDYSIQQLAECLKQHADALGIKWGWGYDRAAVNFEHVLYVEVITGQASFHQAHKGDGPEFSGTWEAGQRSEDTILNYCNWIMGLDVEPKAAKRIEAAEVQHIERQAEQFALFGARA